MRAPPESFNPTIGQPIFMAVSISLQTFSAFAPESEPPKTVKSWAKTAVTRPLTRPRPETTPSPGNVFASMPKSRQRWTLNGSISSNESGSTSSSIRSRAVSLPRSC